MRVKENLLFADDGMMLTNGTDYGKVVILAAGASADQWREVTEAEATAALETISADAALAELLEVLA